MHPFFFGYNASLKNQALVTSSRLIFLSMGDNKNLFQDDEGRTGPFLDEVRKWDLQQRHKYVDEIKAQLDTK